MFQKIFENFFWMISKIDNSEVTFTKDKMIILKIMRVQEEKGNY